ncbi:MAG: tetratricopeptide repeat protein [Paludibacteraceae bacterium]|nr:tetratricopeptide repeat protein [Paludibacteraceae bacterium]
MRKFKVIWFVLLVVLTACSTTKNTPATRAFHQMKVRYNILYNGNNSYTEGLQAINNANEDDFTQVINLYPVSNHDAAQAAASQMDVTIEKCRKCIKLHSIKAKPKPDPKKRKDPKYKLWLESEEFNNEMGNAWLRLGQAEFHKGDFLGSIGTFTYVLKHYQNDADIQACCQLWIARAYAEMGWYYEAEDLLRRIKVDDLSRKNAPLYSAHMADYLLKTKQYHAAIPYVKIALPEEKRKMYRPRFEFVLAQLYELEGNASAAASCYKKVIRMTPPVEMDVNARINMAQQQGLDGVKGLLKMAKLEKNKDRLDVIYGAAGRIYLNARDTAKALEYFDLAIEKSTQAGLAKAQVLVTAGDLYFDLQNYTKAQPCYNEVVTILTSDNEDYVRLSRRAEVLDALIQEVNTVTLQDSLQRLSRMTEKEQMKVCEQIVADLIDAEKKAAEQAALAEREAQQGGLSSVNTLNMLGGGGGSADWYFYNASLLRSGKQEFNKRWNNRSLEDNWRRMSKAGVSSMNMDDGTMINDTTSLNADSMQTKNPTTQPVDDRHNPLYYFQQIPKTQEDLNASDTLLARALYNMVEIYAIRLGDMNLANETLAELYRRYPAYPTPQMQVKQLTAEQLSAMMAEHKAQDSLYEQTYYAFKQGQFKTVKTNKQVAEHLYPESDLIPRFLFLNAVAVARSEGQQAFVAELETMVERYPSSELSAKAKDMLAMMNQGMEAKRGGALSSLENKREQSTISVEDEPTTKQWSDNTEVASYVIITLPSEEEQVLNKMLYEVALFNFSQFLVRDFDIQTLPAYAGGCALRISRFENIKEADWYIDLAKKNESFNKALIIQGAKLISVTEENYSLLEDKLME